jgi:hypothetical protein
MSKTAFHLSMIASSQAELKYENPEMQRTQWLRSGHRACDKERLPVMLECRDFISTCPDSPTKSELLRKLNALFEP